MSFVNLKSIVKHVHDTELESHMEAEKRLEELYEKDRRYLLEIFSSVDFCTDLLKKDGEYRIPRKDGEFIEWLIENYTNPDMRKIRNRQYGDANIEYLYKVITGLLQILKDLEIDEKILEAQINIIMIKTNYPLIVRLYNINIKFMQMWNNLLHYCYNPTFHMTLEQRSDYLDWMDSSTEILKRTMQNEFGRLAKENENDIKNNCMKLSVEDLNYSDRTHRIIDALYKNSEYVELRQRLRELNEKEQPRAKDEKEKLKIAKRLKMILNEVSKEYPIEIEKLTILEKMMYVSESGFVITHKSGDDGWYLVPHDEY